MRKSEGYRSLGESGKELIEGCIWVARFIQECHELGTNDGAGGIILCSLQGLGIADAEANHARITELHGIDATEVVLFGLVEALLGDFCVPVMEADDTM